MAARWNHIFPVYLALTVACLILGCLLPSPLQWILLMTGTLLLTGFVPLVCAIYFMRGYFGNVPH